MYTQRIADNGLVKVPKGPGCKTCFKIFGSYPLLDWAELCSAYKTDSKHRAACDAARRLVESNEVDNLPGNRCETHTSFSFDMHSHFLVYSKNEWLKEWTVWPPEQIGGELRAAHSWTDGSVVHPADPLLRRVASRWYGRRAPGGPAGTGMPWAPDGGPRHGGCGRLGQLGDRRSHHGRH